MDEPYYHGVRGDPVIAQASVSGRTIIDEMVNTLVLNTTATLRTISVQLHYLDRMLAPYVQRRFTPQNQTGDYDPVFPLFDTTLIHTAQCTMSNFVHQLAGLNTLHATLYTLGRQQGSREPYGAFPPLGGDISLSTHEQEVWNLWGKIQQSPSYQWVTYDRTLGANAPTILGMATSTLAQFFCQWLLNA